MTNRKWQMANGRTHNTENRRRSAVLRAWSPFSLLFGPGFLRSLFLAWLIMATLLFTVVFAVEGDVVIKRQGGAGGVAATVFPHWIHRIRYKCYACHPAPFEMKAGANKITMELIKQGKFCGECHNGKSVWGISFETCNRCHSGK